jgi:hypothetical protein
MRRLVAEQIAIAAAPDGISHFCVFMEHETLFTVETTGIGAFTKF